MSTNTDWPGTVVTNGPFWKDLVNEGGWRVQHNGFLDAATPLRPYRLIDPKNVLWASADTAEELAACLPELIEEFSKKTPVLTGEDVKKALVEALKAAGPVIIGVLTKGRSATPKK